MQMLFVGFALIFVYIATVLGRWNQIEQRVRIIFINKWLFLIVIFCPDIGFDTILSKARHEELIVW